MTLSNVIRAQEEVPTSQSDSPTTNMSWIRQNHTQPKCTPKTARSALPGVPIAGASVTNHFIFIKGPWVKLSALRRGFLHHKVAPRPQIWPELAKNTPSQNHPQNCTFRSARCSDGCYIGYQQLKWPWVKLSALRRGFLLTPKSSSRTTNMTWIGQKHAQSKSTQK